MRFYEPRIGELRVLTKFLWFPLCIGRETRWLETATWTERYDPGYFGDGWESVEWGCHHATLAGKEQEP